VDAGLTIVPNDTGQKLDYAQISELTKNREDVVGVIAGLEVWNQEVINLFPNLRAVSRLGVGLDSVDVHYAAQKNIAISTTNSAVVTSVAEHTVGLILSLIRSIPQSHNMVCSEIWNPIMGDTLEGKQVGVVGLGRIGSSVASKLSALGCRVATYDPMISGQVNSGAKMGFVRVLEFDELLIQSDIVTLHVPLQEETLNMIGLQEMKLIGSDGFLINTSRGGIVVETDLLEALSAGIIKGAALDVFSVEPYYGPLLKSKNLIMTPHVGTQTIAARRLMHDEAVANLLKDLGD